MAEYWSSFAMRFDVKDFISQRKHVLFQVYVLVMATVMAMVMVPAIVMVMVDNWKAN
jgi:hypothetical protein